MSDMDDWADALAEQEEAEASQVELENLEAEPADELASTGDEKLDGILDIPVSISMEVGRSNITIRNLLQLNQGSVIELDRVAGEA